MSKIYSNQEIFNTAKVQYEDALKKKDLSAIAENKEECSMNRNCQVNDVVYRCDITRPLPKKVYAGLAER